MDWGGNDTAKPAPTNGFTCGDSDEKVCEESAADVSCGYFAMEFDDVNTCMCVSKRLCSDDSLNCEEGEVRDPRKYCGCMPEDKFDGLSSCMDHLKVDEDEDDATLTIESKKCGAILEVSMDDGWSTWDDEGTLMVSQTT